MNQRPRPTFYTSQSPQEPQIGFHLYSVLYNPVHTFTSYFFHINFNTVLLKINKTANLIRQFAMTVHKFVMKA